MLRGEKGRFQLFGDSVNTAARMETLGNPGSIHVSESCAAALRACGKGNWLVPRKDKVVAKGKGEMSTFFIQLPRSIRGDILNEVPMKFPHTIDVPLTNSSGTNTTSFRGNNNVHNMEVEV